jgi:hypothetical protein
VEGLRNPPVTQNVSSYWWVPQSLHPPYKTKTNQFTDQTIHSLRRFRTVVIDPDGNHTTFTHNADNEVTQQSTPLGNTTYS